MMISSDVKVNKITLKAAFVLKANTAEYMGGGALEYF